MSERRYIPVIAVVGGVGSGKSSVAGWVAKHRNLILIDGDQAGHRVLRHSDIKQRLRERFGAEIFDEQGEVDRSVLAVQVFGLIDKQQQARADLERIVHPAIRELLSKQIADIRNSGSTEAVLLDAAVLFEAGWDDLCDAVVFIESPEEHRLRRVIENRNWSEETFRAREASQLALEAKRNASTHTIENMGLISQAGGQLEQILERIIQRDN